MARIWVLFGIVIGLSLLSASAEGQAARDACEPPDRAYLARWLARPEPGTVSSDSGLIEFLVGATRPISPREVVGTFAFSLVLVRRTQPPDTLTARATFRVPRAGERGELARRFQPVAGGVILTGSFRWDATPWAPARNDTVVAEAAHDRGLSFGLGHAVVCEDCGTFDVTHATAGSLRGWWTADGAVSPESLGYFCARRGAR